METNKELMVQQQERDQLGDQMAKEIENTTLRESLKVDHCAKHKTSLA